jgi:hypothetical protein
MSGEELKQEALDLLEQHRKRWLTEARDYANDLYRAARRPITSDDIWDGWPPPEGVDSKVMGAVFRGGWVPVGYTQTKRASSHARPIRMWVPDWVGNVEET